MSKEEIDYGSFSGDASKFLEENDWSESKIPIVFPGRGYTDVKLFINPNTPKVMWREIIEHEFDTDRKFPCMSMFNKPCEFCNLVSEKGNLWKDPVKSLTKKSYFIYAVLIDYKYEESADKSEKKKFTLPEKGSVIALKLPTGAFMTLTRLIKNGETARDILRPDGNIVRVWNSEKIQYYYDIAILPEKKDVSSIVSDSRDLLVDLNEFFYDKEPTDKMLSKYIRKTDQFKSILEDIVRRKANDGYNPNQGKTRVANERPPVNEPRPDTEVDYSTKRKNPECFGKYDKTSNACFVCTSEKDCKEQSIPF